MPNVIQNADLIDRLYFEVMQLGDMVMDVDNMNDPDLEDAISTASIALKDASDGLFNAAKAIAILRREVA